MLEIDVFIGLNKQKGFEKMAPVLVQPDPAASHSGDDVIWHFHALDSAVQSVQVDFGDDCDPFFECRDDSKRAAKCHAKLSGNGHGRHGHLLGTTPSLRDRGAKASKYTIRAFDGDPENGGKEIEAYRLDPIVVTCDP